MITGIIYRLSIMLCPLFVSAMPDWAHAGTPGIFGITDSTDIKKEKEEKKNKRASRLSPGDYVSWVESSENGLCIKTSRGALDFAVQYRPPDYIILKEAGTSNNILTRRELKERRRELEGLEYYTFTIALNDGRKDLLKSTTRGVDEYNRLLLYFAGQLQQDLKLVSGTDTLECRLFHFERTYGITSYARFIVGFEQPFRVRRSGERIFLFKADIFGIDEVRLFLKEEDLRDIPGIIFKG